MVLSVNYGTNRDYLSGSNLYRIDAVPSEKIKAFSNAVKPVDFYEGIQIVGKGIQNKLSCIIKSVINHPIKTLSTMAISTAALMALPFFGISMATGGAVLTVCFGGLAVLNTLNNIYVAKKQSTQGNYAGLRNTLNNIGCNIVDLAMTLPFIPKAIKHLKRNVPLYFEKHILVEVDKKNNILSRIDRYYGGIKEYKINPNGTTSIVKSDSLFSQIKNAKTWKERFSLLLKQDKRETMYEQLNQTYKQIAKQRGTRFPNDIKFYAEPIKNIKDGSKFGHSNWRGGFIKNNEADIVHFNINSTRIKGTTLKDFTKTVGHEHRHIEQNSMMARAEGLAPELQRTEGYLNLMSDNGGIIKKGSLEYTLAEKFHNAKLSYAADKAKGFDGYLNNFLEVDARAVGETEIATQIAKQMENNTGIKNMKHITCETLPVNPTRDIVLANGLPIAILSGNKVSE